MTIRPLELEEGDTRLPSTRISFSWIDELLSRRSFLSQVVSRDAIEAFVADRLATRLYQGQATAATLKQTKGTNTFEAFYESCRSDPHPLFF
jgi:hypothetical protein